MRLQRSVERRRGIVADWNDDRGFGFIKPASGGPRVFVHATSFPRGPRPSIGCDVTYVESRDERGRASAGSVRYLTRSRGRRSSSEMSRAVVLVVSFFALGAILVVTDRMPVTFLAAYGVLSGVAILVYRADKTAAQRGTWRTSESTLHLLALVGGWPGALVAQRYFRHKTRKQPFRTIFWVTVAANCAALAWFVYEVPVALP
jgi:uncharacterized membrane protein YsdA (DUF1294 family)/cold shock CspA family protein